MCIYICMHMYILHVYIHVYIQIHVFIHIYILHEYIHTYLHTCILHTSSTKSKKDFMGYSAFEKAHTKFASSCNIHLFYIIVFPSFSVCVHTAQVLFTCVGVYTTKVSLPLYRLLLQRFNRTKPNSLTCHTCVSFTYLWYYYTDLLSLLIVTYI